MCSFHELELGLPVPESPPTVQTGKMAGASESVAVAPSQDLEIVAGTDSQTAVPDNPREDFRVHCTSKRAVTELVEMCGRFVQKLGDALPEEIRERALRDAQWVRTKFATYLSLPYPVSRGLRAKKDPTPGLSGVDGARAAVEAAGGRRGENEIDVSWVLLITGTRAGR